MKTYRFLLRVQGLFYFFTGVWPLLHIESFMAVTGPKYDIWLVKTVGLLITACSLGMLAASFRKMVQPDLLLVLFGYMFFLAAIDVYYVAREVILPVYLADAAVEVLFLLIWLWWWFRKKPELQPGE